MKGHSQESRGQVADLKSPQFQYSDGETSVKNATNLQSVVSIFGIHVFLQVIWYNNLPLY